MRKFLVIIMMAMMPGLALAQTGPFAPAHDEPGTTAIHADSSAFVAWATGCVVEAGPMNIANPSLGVAGAGYPAENAIGVPDGTYGVACLGDGGYATLTFASPICNQPGPDFAVFENGFKSGAQFFLEIAFVEVSSDGEHFFRFPAITAVQYETQLGGFATMDPSYIHNFAGKYAAFYGTPFELDEIPDNPLLNKNSITHVRVVDVIGCIDPEYCTYDSQGHPVNDPWPTPFASSGFDLDAVGVIHDVAHTPGFGVEENEEVTISVYPNPAHDFIRVETMCTSSVQGVELYSVTGQMVLSSTETEINVSDLNPGMYIIRVNCGDSIFTERVIIK